jgi:hypothetical protein
LLPLKLPNDFSWLQSVQLHNFHKPKEKQSKTDHLNSFGFFRVRPGWHVKCNLSVKGELFSRNARIFAIRGNATSTLLGEAALLSNFPD